MSTHGKAENDFTELQKEKLAELKEALGKDLLDETPLFNDSFSLMRWLVGWDYKIDEILHRFKRTSKILRIMKVNDLVIEDMDEVNRYCTNLNNASGYFQGGVMSLDNEGNVVALSCMGLTRPSEIAKCCKFSDVFRFKVVELVLAYQLVKLQEKKHGKMLGVRVILDLRAVGVEHILMMNTFSNVIPVLLSMFPDISSRFYVINSPAMVATIFRIANRILPEQTKQKFVFLSSPYHEALVAEIGAENLFEHWGGKLKPKCGDSRTGTLRMGGMPTLDMRYSHEKNSLFVHDCNLTKISVPARGKKEVTICVENERTPTHIQWFFYTSSDIEFGVYTEKGEEIWPSLRLTTDHVPEYGTIECKSSGNYKLVFDNTFSSWFNKEVRYSVNTKPVV